MAQSASKVGRSRGVWTVLILLFAGFAVVGPVKMIRAQADREDRQGAASAGDSVVMAQLAFTPATLTVDRGTEVVFRNDDVAPHTVTAEDGVTADSGVLSPGKTFRLVLDEPFDYFCAIHPQMKGQVLLTG
jgi:plastocyanin